MATPDKVFMQTYAWYKASIDRVLAPARFPRLNGPRSNN